MRTQANDLKAELKAIDHFLKRWEHYGKKKNQKQSEQPVWMWLEKRRYEIIDTLNNIQ